MAKKIERDDPRTPAALRGDRPEGFCFRFTPAEWRAVLEDPDFLSQPDNSFRAPRRLMGVAVRIIPDHSLWI